MTAVADDIGAYHGSAPVMGSLAGPTLGSPRRRRGPRAKSSGVGGDLAEQASTATRSPYTRLFSGVRAAVGPGGVIVDLGTLERAQVGRPLP